MACFAFIPFSLAGKSLLEMTKMNGPDGKGPRNWQVRLYNGGKTFDPLPSAEDELYVIGHCMEGADYLYAHHTGDQKVDAKTVVDFLVRANVPTNISKIVLLACNAAAGSRQSSSFRQKFEAALVLRGFAIKNVLASSATVSPPDYQGRTYHQGHGKRSAMRPTQWK